MEKELRRSHIEVYKLKGQIDSLHKEKKELCEEIRRYDGIQKLQEGQDSIKRLPVSCVESVKLERFEAEHGKEIAQKVAKHSIMSNETRLIHEIEVLERK